MTLGHTYLQAKYCFLINKLRRRRNQGDRYDLEVPPPNGPKLSDDAIGRSLSRLGWEGSERGGNLMRRGVHSAQRAFWQYVAT